MPLRINHNISAINSHRNLIKNTEVQSKNLERLSSGLKINRGADSPAGLIISERMRAQIVGLKQAIDNSETGITMLQTAEGALEEVNRSLVNARQLAISSANEAVNDEAMLAANQQEFEDSLRTIDRIARISNYGTKAILDGSMGANGVASGDNLEFISATEKTKSSPVSGYAVDIREAATKSTVRGTVALTQALVDAGEQLTFTEGGKTLNFKSVAGESVETTMNRLEKAILSSGMKIELVRSPGSATTPNAPQQLIFQHKQYGSEHTFHVGSTTAGILSAQADTPDKVQNGADVAGFIGGELGIGRGQFLTGSKPSRVSGLKIRYTGEDVPPAGKNAGTVTLSQNSLVFHVGPNVDQSTSFSLRSVSSNKLGNGVKNGSDYRSLRDVELTDAEKAQDAILIIDQAIDEITRFRGKMGAFQKNGLESNLNYLRNAHENVTNAESIIRDADMAEEMTAFARNQILVQSSTAMLAQANQTPSAVMQLING
ncbi:MAG: flagellin [SAR324 cluster bacterium]|nr:flagellin [SAR324 cluster bacterium]MBL7035234.1 flagellin [SAR324 cluster bacterium]